MADRSYVEPTDGKFKKTFDWGSPGNVPQKNSQVEVPQNY